MKFLLLLASVVTLFFAIDAKYTTSLNIEETTGPSIEVTTGPRVEVNTDPNTEVTEIPDTCVNLSFACQDLHVARKCKAVTSCIEIWETIKAPEDSNNEICDLCKQMVQQARDQLLSNQTQEEMKEVFEGTCNFIPIKAVAHECIKVVDELVPEIIDMLASRMDPNMVCTVAGLCNNGLLRKLIKEQHKTAKPLEIPLSLPDSKCKSCTQGMTFVRKALQFIPENDFALLLLRSCMEQFSGTHAQCAELIFKLLPVYQHIISTDEESLCSLLGTCKPIKQDPKSIECGLCTRFVGVANELRKAAVPLQNVKDYALELCREISVNDSTKTQCQDVINSNFDTVVFLLWTKEEHLCVKTCGQEVVEKENFEYNKYKILYAGSTACDVCQAIIMALDEKARSPNIKAQVKKDLSSLCDKTGNIASICHSFLDEYFDFFYEEIISSIDPQQVCHLFKFCPAQLAEAAKIGDGMCKMCQLYNNLKEESKPLVLDGFQALTLKELVNSCSTGLHMPDSENCVSFMKELTPIIFNFLKFVGPETMCGQMELCPKLQETSVSVGDNLTCEFCEALVGYLKSIIDAKSTEAEFKTALMNMCKDLKRYSTQCSNLVDEYFDQFYDFLKNNLNPETACKAIGLCDKSSVSHIPALKLSPAKRVNLTPIVSVQLTKAERRRQMLKQNRYIPLDGELGVEIEAGLEREAATPLREGIHVQPNYDTKHEKAEGIEVEPSFDTKRRNRNRFSELEDELEEKESNSIESSEKQPQQLPIERLSMPHLMASNEIECSVCKAVVVYLEKELEDNRTEDSVRKALEKVCGYFPKELSDQCKDFIDEYTDLFIKLLVNNTDPNTICALLKACPSVAESMLPKDLPAEVEGLPQCVLCEKIIGYLEKQLGTNKTEEAIKAGLEKVCGYLPAKYSKECDDLVEKYADKIIDLFVNDVAPSLICAALGLCPGENSVGLESLDECTVCQYVLHYIQEQLMNPATEDEIKKEVEKVCSKLPKVLMENCDAYIEQYGDALITLIAQGIDPSILCVRFKICPSGNAVIEPKVTIQSLKIDTCSTCEMVVNYMDKLLENEDIDNEITALVEKICQILPMSARDQCTQIIGVYGPYLLDMIGQLSNPISVCQAVDLCSKAAERQLLGGEKCTFGPSYWCQSMEHATACNAHTYCKQKMWKP